MATIVSTPRLIIREFNANEENIYLSHFNDEDVCKHIPKRSKEERINIFRTALANYSKTKQTGIWGMFDKQNEAFIGSCLLRPFGDEPGSIEIGYSLEKSCWSKGIATAMAQALVKYIFTFPDINEVVGITTLENVASQKVLEKAGLLRMNDLTKNGEVVGFFRAGKA